MVEATILAGEEAFRMLEDTRAARPLQQQVKLGRFGAIPGLLPLGECAQEADRVPCGTVAAKIAAPVFTVPRDSQC